MLLSERAAPVWLLDRDNPTPALSQLRSEREKGAASGPAAAQSSFSLASSQASSLTVLFAGHQPEGRMDNADPLHTMPAAR